jgi:hypothetical protein
MFSAMLTSYRAQYAPMKSITDRNSSTVGVVVERHCGHAGLVNWAHMRLASPQIM